MFEAAAESHSTMVILVVIVIIIMVIISIFVMFIITVVIVVVSIVMVFRAGRWVTTPFPRVGTDKTMFSYETVSIGTAVDSTTTRVITRCVNLSINWRREFRTLDFCIWKKITTCCFAQIYIYIILTEFLISSYDAPLAQRASYLALHSSLFGPDGTVNYDYIVTNSINSLLIGSRCRPNGAYTNHY